MNDNKHNNNNHQYHEHHEHERHDGQEPKHETTHEIEIPQTPKSWQELFFEYMEGKKFRYVLIGAALVGIILGYVFTRTYFIQFNTGNTVGETPINLKKPGSKTTENASGPVKYIVYVGQLNDKNMIDKISLDLQSQGYPNKIASRNNAYTINLGEFTDKAKASALSTELEDKGYPAFIDTVQ